MSSSNVKVRARGEVKAVAVAWWILGGLAMLFELLRFEPGKYEVGDGIGIALAVMMFVTSIGVYRLWSWSRRAHIVLNGIIVAIALFILVAVIEGGNLFPPSHLIPIGAALPILVALTLIYPFLAIRVLAKSTSAAQFRGDFSQVPAGAGLKTWLKRVGIGAAIVAVVAILAGLWISSRGARQWKEFVDEHEAILVRIKSDPGKREPLVGPSRPGNTWDELNGLLKELKKLEEGSKPGRFSLEGVLTKVPPDPKEIERGARLLDRGRTILDGIRAAVRCERAVYPFDWERNVAAEIPSLLGAQTAGHALSYSAWTRWQEGKADAALDEIATVLQVTLDMQHPPMMICAMIAASMTRMAGDVLLRCIPDERATPAQLQRIETLLARTDAGFASAPQLMEAEYASMGMFYRAIEAGKDGPERIPWSGFAPWAFSRRIPLAEAGRVFSRQLQEFRRREPLAWKDRDNLMSAYLDEVNRSGNLFASFALPGTDGVEKALLEARARLCVLRAATFVRLGKIAGTSGWPADPFTLQPLATRVEAGTIRISSVWSDGKESAQGSWKPAKDEDLVVEVKAP